MQNHALAALALACAPVTPAEVTWSVETTLARQSDAATATTLDLFPGLTASLPLDSGWSLGLEAHPEFTLSHRSGTARADDPVLSLILTLTTPDGLTLGLDAGTTFADWSAPTDTTLAAFIARPDWRLTLGDTGAAAAALCLTPDLRTLGDLTASETCPVFLETGTLRLETGQDDGLRHGVSVAQDNGATSASYALSGPLGAARFSLGAEVQTAPGRDGHLLQAGLSHEGAVWTLAIAAALTHSAEGRDTSVQAAATRSVSDRLSLSLAASYGALAAGRESGAGLALDWTLIPDRLTMTAGLAGLRSGTTTATRVSMTLVLSGKGARRSVAAKRLTL
jgi:hypothetical protein